jgi:hypothetical protein
MHIDATTAKVSYFAPPISCGGLYLREPWEELREVAAMGSDAVEETVSALNERRRSFPLGAAKAVKHGERNAPVAAPPVTTSDAKARRQLRRGA